MGNSSVDGSSRIGFVSMPDQRLIAYYLGNFLHFEHNLNTERAAFFQHKKFSSPFWYFQSTRLPLKYCIVPIPDGGSLISEQIPNMGRYFLESSGLSFLLCIVPILGSFGIFEQLLKWCRYFLEISADCLSWPPALPPIESFQFRLLWNVQTRY